MRLSGQTYIFPSLAWVTVTVIAGAVPAELKSDSESYERVCERAQYKSLRKTGNGAFDLLRLCEKPSRAKAQMLRSIAVTTIKAQLID
jgi:hypothetical protein